MNTKHRIVILTYQARHRKTYDTLCLLKARGYQNVYVCASPMHYQKQHQPLIQHRPTLIDDMPTAREVCKNFGFAYAEGKLEEFGILSDDIILICGAGILPDEFISTHIIINSHPGYIPNCRGLDAYKWAIYEGQPIGVTSHYLGREIDAGKVIERRVIPIADNDSFYTVAQKIYENEIYMLVSAIEIPMNECQNISASKYPLHKRMPRKYEENLLDLFEKRKKLSDNTGDG